MVNFWRLGLIFSLLLLFSINLFNCEEYDYESDYEISMNDSLSANESLAINGTIDDYQDEYDDEEDEDECTVDSFFDHYSELILPDDYEEGKQMDFMQKSYTFSETIERVKRLHQYQQNVSSKLDPILKRLAPRLSELLFYIDLPSECMTSLVRIGQAAQNREQWAMKFLDSMPSGKIASLQINSLPFGEYDECLGIESEAPATLDKPKIYGHYCSLGLPANMLPPADLDDIDENKRLDQMLIKKVREQLNGSDPREKELNFIRDQLQDETDGQFIYGVLRYIEYLGPEKVRLPPGLCLPSTCKPKDVEFAINKVLYPMTRFSMIINPDCDYLGKPIKLSVYQIISIAALTSVTIVCAVCSLVSILRDRLLPKRRSGFYRITDCFSIVPNIKAIFNSSQKIENFSGMDGIRAILCFWMVLQHEYESGYIPLHTKRARQSAPYKFNNQLKYIFFINWNLIDTFFLMGGFMTCYMLLSKLDKNGGKFDYIKYALYRYLRMLPIILTAIAITFTFELFGDGPLWPLITDVLQKPCIDKPLPTIFMANNFVSWPDMIMCVPISWYSAADFQLYLMAPLIILVIYYWPIVGVTWNILLISVGSLIALAPKLLFGIPHMFEAFGITNLDTMAKIISHQYLGIEAHVQLYVVGILLGYLIKRHPDLYLGGIIGEVVIWLTTWGLTFYAIFWHRNYFNLVEYKVTETEIISWISLSKVCYAAGWFWAFYACCTGRAGFINKFFSWKGFKPIAYLMLEIYMLHLFVIIYRIGTTREHQFYSDYYVWTVIIYDFILAFVLALTVNVLVTKPFANLLKLYLNIEDKTEVFDDNNNLLVSSNGKPGTDESKDNQEVIILTNLAFDEQLMSEKQLKDVTFAHNIDNNLTNCEKDNALKI